MTVDARRFFVYNTLTIVKAMKKRVGGEVRHREPGGWKRARRALLNMVLEPRTDCGSPPHRMRRERPLQRRGMLVPAEVRRREARIKQGGNTVLYASSLMNVRFIGGGLFLCLCARRVPLCRSRSYN